MDKRNITITRFGQDQLKKGKKKWLKPLLIGIAVCIVITAVAMISECVIRNNIAGLSVDNDTNATWIGSLASYWGGILGGIFSGVIAIFGVFYTIQFTREADRNKERQGIQPFLNMKIVAKPQNRTIRSFNIADEPKFKNGKAEQEFYPIYLEITNIGNGFASTLTFGTGETFSGVCYKEVFTVNETKEILLNVQTNKVGKGAKFFIWFADSMTNEYVQHYEIKRNESGMGFDLDVGYPNLIERC